MKAMLFNKLPNKKIWILLGSVVLVAGLIIFFINKGGQIDFSAQVKPILNKNCISCHGGVKAKAGFSVLFREEALAITESGKPAIMPGDPDGSEFIRRLTLKDAEERMPYKHAPLSKEDIDILTKWVKQGAKWGEHWAYVPVKPVSIPAVENEWINNEVDKFIYAKLEKEEIKPAAEADKATLLRRVSLDLIGLYPSDSMAASYLNSKNENAYELLVDRLLASPAFGEKWASMWLDLARYADTKGYEADKARNIWAYRDWVIKAFNDDKPYDKFIIEQIAGDLLPNPTDAQYIATAFHRNSMTNDEGGTDNEEFRVAAAMDRVNTTWEALMSTTFACVQCHSHPYDPFKHEEYYSFLAYFNNSRDEDVVEEYPLLKEYDSLQKKQVDSVVYWARLNGSELQANKLSLFLRTGQPAVNSIKADSLKNAVLGNNNYQLHFRNGAVARLGRVDLEQAGQLIAKFNAHKKGGVLKLRFDASDGPVFATISTDKASEIRVSTHTFPAQKGVHDVFLTYHNPGLAANVNDILISFDWFAFMEEFPGKGQVGFEKFQKLFSQLLNSNVSGIPIMVENPTAMLRKSNVFERGSWRSLGKEVSPAVPNSLSFAMPANMPKNRMGMAMWLTNKQNPLVSRTMANRLWEQLFGTGIAETLEDIGTQGILPTHKELLDYLSWKLMNDYNWSIKKLLKELVMSATYRQSSVVTEELKLKDPFNKWYARGARVRLSAEQIRDQALAVSGLLNDTMYGKWVMPWQPDGIWNSPYNDFKWTNSENKAQYRRAIYTFWKRTAPYPSMVSFDGAQRNVCSPRRIRTNTPLQALVTLNDSAFLDMARHFAFRMKTAGDSTDVKAQISTAYQWMFFKPIGAGKLNLFVNLYREAMTELKSGKNNEIASMVGNKEELANAETAALVVVANALFNLDEMLTKN